MYPGVILYSLFVIGVNSVDKLDGWKTVESLRGDKPVLVIGAPRVPPPFGHPPGDVTIDVDTRAIEGCPGAELGDVRSIPYPDKYFSVAFASHVIEHLPTVEDARIAMRELRRVADHVIIISPHSYDIINQIHPGHYLIVEPAGVTCDQDLRIRARGEREKTYAVI